MSLLNERVYDTNIGKTGVSLDRVRKLFHGTVKVLEKDGSPFRSGEEDNCHWFTTGFEFPFFNQVSIYNGDPEVFEKALERFYEQGLVHAVFLGGGGLAHAEALKAKGYENKGAVPLMGYALDPQKDKHVLRDGLEVKRVLTEDDLAIIQQLASDGFEMSLELTERYTNGSLGIADSFRYYLLDNGVPVSTSHFIRIGTFLGCWDVATPKEHQRKGYGDELMRWVFATHAAMGDELVVLQASSAGQPLYRRLGYQFLEHIQGWHMEDTTRMRRFTHHNLQFGPYSLRPWVSTDKEWSIPALDEEEIRQWMGMPNPFEEKDFEPTLKRWTNVQKNGVGIAWVIEEGGVPLGMISCHHTDWKFKRTEIGYMAFASSRGKGMIPTVLRALTEFLFAEYEFERVEVRAVAENGPSRRAAEKAGFTFEGLQRRNFLNLGEVVDDAVFSMIKSDLAG